MSKSIFSGSTRNFVQSAIKQVGRDYGKTISNGVFGDKHATPIRNSSSSQDASLELESIQFKIYDLLEENNCRKDISNIDSYDFWGEEDICSFIYDENKYVSYKPLNKDELSKKKYYAILSFLYFWITLGISSLVMLVKGIKLYKIQNKGCTIELHSLEDEKIADRRKKEGFRIEKKWHTNYQVIDYSEEVKNTIKNASYWYIFSSIIQIIFIIIIALV